MSATISGFVPNASGFGTLQQLIAGASATKAKLDQLSAQSSTGYVASSYAGIDAVNGAAAGTAALSLAPQISSIDSTTSAMNAATGRMSVQQSALSSISQVASGVLSQLQTINSLTPQALGSLANSAKQALAQVARLLDTKEGGVYVFGGQSSSTPPVPDPSSVNSSGFAAAIAAAVGNLSSAGAGATSAATLAIAQSNAAGTTPFAASLGANPALPLVDTGNGVTQTVGIAANANAFVASTGADTTGSYMRDIMRGLASVAALGSANVSSSQFQGFVKSTAASLGSAVDTLNQDAGVLGNIQSSLSTQSQSMAQTKTALSTQLANVDQVDMASTLANLSATQTALQASYQLIAAQKSLSLTQYL